MAKYSYKCTVCGAEEEREFPMSESPKEIECGICASVSKRQIPTIIPQNVSLKDHVDQLKSEDPELYAAKKEFFHRKAKEDLASTLGDLDRSKSEVFSFEDMDFYSMEDPD